MRILLAVSTLTIAALAPLAAQDYESTRIAEGVYQFRWVGHNAMLVTTSEGVLAFDPINPDAARAMAAEIQKIAPGMPLAGVVYSHSDADHATGANVLIESMGQEPGTVPIIAQENAVAPIRRRASPDQPEPTVTFSERMTLQVGGRRIELHYLGPSHTDNILVPFIADVGVAFAVDFVARDRMGYRDLPGWRFPQFFDAVHGLLAIPFQTMVFGHGPAGDRASIHRQVAYYDDLTAAVRRAIADGLTEDEAAASIRLAAYADWGNYGEWFPLNVRGVYRWLAGSGM